MLFNRSEIFGKEWLEVIFANRNQAYGAYQLRLFADKATSISLGIVLLSVSICSAVAMISKPDVSIKDIVQVDNLEENTQVIEINEIVFPKEEVAEKTEQRVAQDVPAVDLLKFTEINPSSKPTGEEVVTADEANNKKAMLASITMKGMKDGTLVPKGTFGKVKKDGALLGSLTGEDDEGNSGAGGGVFAHVEVMPMPPGGMEAFVKWVAQNYEFPAAAEENQVKGLVQISFVVEKDGSLSSFVVTRDLGYGTGEKAVKLLKTAKKWSPGVQNGREVRVSYTLPIRLSTIN